MISKDKYYLYSQEQSGFKEIKWFRFKFLGSVAATVVVILSLILGTDYYIFDYLGFSHQRVNTLTRENQALRQELAMVLSKTEGLEKTISSLGNEGNELRRKVALPVLDPNTVNAGYGGSAPTDFDDVGSSDLRDLLERSSSLIDKLSSQVNLQKESYVEVEHKYEYNEDLFKHIPALKPMEGSYSSNDFGMRLHPVLKIMKFHEGLDIINDIGTKIYAPADGVVEFAGHSGGGYGIVLTIKHGFGYETLYGHLSRVLVREGQKIKRGDLIAKSGNTGLTSGPHLHYEVHYNGVRQNPDDYFLDDVTPQDYRKQFVNK